MIVGFTGSQHGMNDHQYRALGQLFRWLPITLFRHGDCVGSDYEAHQLLRIVDSSVKIHIHPSDITQKRAFVQGDRVYRPLEPLSRNRYIAGCLAEFPVDLLIATPYEDHEIVRSGTWSTVRYARKIGTPRIILLP